jgi:hypothetical protein
MSVRVDPADLAVVEARLQAILEPYRSRLEGGAVYGVETLKRPGVGAHDFFAGIKPGARFVSFYLKPVYTWPRLLEGITPGLRKRMSGKSSFTFSTIDEGLLTELAALVVRCFEAYEARGAAGAAPETDG